MKIKRAYPMIIAASFIIIFIGILLMQKRIKIAPIFAEKYDVTGVDVSHYQGEIDWDKLAKQNIDFAFIKATEGSSHIDECFYDNWQEAQKTSLYIGAYHFFSFDSDGEKQARLFIDTVGSLDGKIAPVVDVEFYGDKEDNPPSKDEVVKQLDRMLKILEDYYQTKPIIYTTYQVYYKYIKEAFAEYPLWIRNVYYKPLFMGRKWTFWQYTDTAVLNGYQGSEKYIDRNVFRGTEEELQVLLVSCGGGKSIEDEELLSEKEKFEVPDSFFLRDEEEGIEEEIPIEHCSLIYDRKYVKVYSYLGLTDTLFILTPEHETVIFPVKDFWVDEEQEAVWMLESKEAAQGKEIQIRKIDLRWETFLDEMLRLDSRELETLLAETYGLFKEERKAAFWDFYVDLSGRKQTNGEIFLGGIVSGVYQETNKKYEIVYEIDREDEEVTAKGYLQELALSPLCQEFLFHNLTVELTVENPFAEKLSFFDDELYLSEYGEFHKQFATGDMDGDGVKEFLFGLRQVDGKEELVYVLSEEKGKLICRDILHVSPEKDSQGNVLRWFDCASFLEIPAQNCQDYKSRDEVFSAVEKGDYSVINRKYAAPPGCGSDMDFVGEMKYAIEKELGRIERCDIDGNGLDELIVWVKYESEDKTKKQERIDFILGYRNGEAVCLYYDWCDGMEWLCLGDAGQLIHCSCSLSSACTYYGFYECTLNARGIKDIVYTGYGIEMCKVYESSDSGFWWWRGQQSEIAQTGTYYTRVRAKNAGEIQDTATADGRIKELIAEEQFFKEYQELTGNTFENFY